MRTQANKTAIRLLREIYDIANECPKGLAHKIQNRASKTLCYVNRRTDIDDYSVTLCEEERRNSQAAQLLAELKAGKTLTIVSPEVTQRGITRLASRMWEIADDAIRNDREYRVVKGWQQLDGCRVRTYSIEWGAQ